MQDETHPMPPPMERARGARVGITIAVVTFGVAMVALSAALVPATVSAAGTSAGSAAPPAIEAGPPPPAASTIPAGGSFGCPMHPRVRADGPGKCLICGMDLMPMGAFGGPPYRVELTTTPRAVKTGETVHLLFRIEHPVTRAAITDLQIVHEKPFHLFLVSDDLEIYQHLHPTLGPPERPTGAAGEAGASTFEVETVLPRAGLYHLFCDFLPVAGTPQIVELKLATEGYLPPRSTKTPGSPGRARRLTADPSLEKVVDGIRFRLTLQPPLPAAGVALALQYRLEDAATGAPITDLEPYLGAWGHTLILAEDATDFVHSHPTRLVPSGSDPASARGGPDVAFNASVVKPGIHRLWSQFQRAGKVTTVSFTIDVAWPTRLAMWDGSRWRSRAEAGAVGAAGPSTAGALGSDPVATMGNINGPVFAMAAKGKDVFVAGEVIRGGRVAGSQVARWNGRVWSPLGGDFNGSVGAIAVSGKDVYVGGDFGMAGAVHVSGVARWDGREWSPLGAGVSGCLNGFCRSTVNTIVVDRDGSLIVGGVFTRAGTRDAGGIARWDGKNWKPLGTGVRTGELDGEVLALALDARGRVYAGGSFTDAGGTPARSIAMWDGSRWSALGARGSASEQGVGGGIERVYAMAFAAGALYVAGDFTRAGPIDVQRAARWDGASWSTLGLRTREPVTMIIAGPERRDVFLGGGTFTLVDGSTTRGVVRFDGANWSTLGAGIGGGPFLAHIQALATDDRGRVYAAGGPFLLEDAATTSPAAAPRRNPATGR